jgi:hypothetical protein
MTKTQHFSLQPSESIIFQAATNIYASYIVAGQVTGENQARYPARRGSVCQTRLQRKLVCPICEAIQRLVIFLMVNSFLCPEIKFPIIIIHHIARVQGVYYDHT